MKEHELHLISHRRWRMLLSAYVDQQLSEGEQVRLQAHLQRCAACTGELEELRATVTLLRRMPQPALPRSFLLTQAPETALQARGLGATRLQAAKLQLREVRTSLVAAIAAGFGAIISEVGAAMIVGGNILGETRVMTTTIVLETRRGNFGVAIALGVVLLVVALLVNIVLTSLGSRTRRPVMS